MIRPATPLALLLLALSPAAAIGQTGRTITVNGQAEIRVAPNEVLISVGVQTDDLDIARARAANDARVKAIVAAATGAGVAAEHVRTDFLDIQPRYRDEYERRTFLGYFARRSLSITLRDVSRFEALLSAVLTAGANYLHGVEFRTTELRKHRDAARANAITAAREKAADMAAGLNAAVGSAINVQEGHSGWWSAYGTAWGGRGGGAAFQNVVQERSAGGPSEGTLVPGQISVSATVTVTFELR